MGRRSSVDASNSPPSQTAARNERLVRDHFAAVWNDGDLGPFDTDAVSDDYVFHHQSDDDYSVDELRGAWANWHEAFPDLGNEIEDLIATANRVVVRYRFSGTHGAEAMGVQATGIAAETAGIVVFRVEEGQILEAWAIDDTYGLLQQLGAITDG
ncbi:ester cyclase [Halosolutus halophilus]|uniref:ester cyclase n=1 Tax=Halosolutus halophilus TaxID=1552990 RepID=UPI0022352E14|nr:ester cyclase [Halosolutus halophilus]